ncbi:cytochrome P450 [Paenibacillus profundus]|uniref:Cytochrome P450 n=1 Tax=Paenibacillus profundus TaxID=1173085 RepID=A0ABS8YEH9_9BACL|nr:cytochrome P450 [Paenibacillus profundus]MCE5169967.1 cytochrome P450 [Paenibacillus profundus]
MEWANENNILPLSHFAQKRATDPISCQDGVWNVYKYKHVKAIFGDHEHFSSQAEGDPGHDEPIEFSILRRDPPKHRQLRTLVSQAFTPRAIEALIPRIEALSHELFDRAEGKGAMEAVSDFAGPLPIIVIADMLGIPVQDRDRFKEWSDALVGNDYERYVWCQKEMAAYFAAIAEERRREPQDDLISRLVQAKADGDPLQPLELIGFCILLLVAGNETTTNLLSSALLCFDSRKDVWYEIRQDRSLLAPAIEEVLRYCSPVQMMVRRVKQTTELDGFIFQEGQIVNLWIGSANHDEDIFEQPESFNIRRSPNPHLAFGHGIHFCLGAQLARLEATIALNALLDRFPDFHRDRSQMLERIDSWLVFGVKRQAIQLK